MIIITINNDNENNSKHRNNSNRYRACRRPISEAMRIYAKPWWLPRLANLSTSVSEVCGGPELDLMKILRILSSGRSICGGVRLIPDFAGLISFVYIIVFLVVFHHHGSRLLACFLMRMSCVWSG